MITRIHLDAQGNETARRLLPSWAAFKTQSNPDWEEQVTSVWPIQKFSWRDLTLRRSRDTTNVREAGFAVKYEIAPVGLPGPGRNPVPPSPTAQPGKYKGSPIPLFFCGQADTTNVVNVTTDIATDGHKTVVAAGFTNGILSTQNLRKQLNVKKGQAPTKKQLEKHIDPNNPDKPDAIRDFLTADALPLISGFIEHAKKENCDLYCSLYELNDPKLLKLLAANGDRLHLILSTASSTKPPKGSRKPVVWDGTNKDSRKLLRAKAVEFHDRMFNNSSHIGHNKFAVLVERATNKAKALLAGSTNWTFTGLCTQTNNVVIVDDEKAADAYFRYWKRLRGDKLPVPKSVPPTVEELSAPNSNKQGQGLRTADMTPDKINLDIAGKPTSVQLWFSPNTKAVTKGTATPPDLKVAFELMNGAEQAIFFLTFMPSVRGDNSIISQALEASLAKPELLTLGAISDGRALPDDSAPRKTTPSKKTKATAKKSAKKSTKKTTKRKTSKRRKTRTVAMAKKSLVKRSAKVGASKNQPAKKGPAPKPAIYTNPKAPKVLMVRAAAISDFDLIGDWEREMLKYGQAIIHDKIVVIDPLSEDKCTVITGSHNLGYKASYANDENMLIIRGNRALAIAYAVHILDVYEHYKFRAVLEEQAYLRSIGKGKEKPPVGKGILNTDDTWQDPYFDGSKGQDREYFLGAAGP